MVAASAKAQAVEFVAAQGVVRRSTLVRLLEHLLGPKSESAWASYVSRLVRESELEYLLRGTYSHESVIGTADRKKIPLLEVQAAHEIRVSEVAVEFIRAGFDWMPPNVSGKGASKVSDGVAWLGECRIEVEVELSPKKQARWKGIIERYRNQQASEPIGVCYLFATDGLRRSFRQVMSKAETPGWWHLAVSDGDTTEERQATDLAAARSCRAAIEDGKVRATMYAQTRLTVETEPDPVPAPDIPTPPAPADDASAAPAPTGTSAALKAKIERRRAEKAREVQS